MTEEASEALEWEIDREEHSLFSFLFFILLLLPFLFQSPSADSGREASTWWL